MGWTGRDITPLLASFVPVGKVGRGRATVRKLVGSDSSYLGNPRALLVQLGVIVRYPTGYIVFAAAVRMLTVILTMPPAQA